MRKFIILCVLSGIAGGFAAVVWFGGTAVEPQSVAQDSTPWTQPRANPSGGNPPVNTTPPPGTAYQPSAADLQDLTPEEQVNVMVYINVNRSVVNINTKGYQPDRFLLFAVPAEGEGSGSVLDRQGHILTNFHVVDGAKQIQATLFDGKDYKAQLVGVDPITDIAVLKIDAPADSLYPVGFGSSANLLVGQKVFAIGNPFGLERTAVHRHYFQFEPFTARPAHATHDKIDHPDRRRDQPRQLGRTTVGQSRPDDRDVYRHCQ